MALQWGIVPPELKSKVAANLATRVKSDGMHLDVGVLGAKAILNALSDNGQAATAYALAAQDSYPSWGWWIKNGATTLYENWNIQAARDISLNHMMFGEIGAWFLKVLVASILMKRTPVLKTFYCLRILCHSSVTLPPVTVDLLEPSFHPGRDWATALNIR